MATKTYVGKAPATYVRFDNGTSGLVYAGAPVPGHADKEDLKRLVAEGYLVEVLVEVAAGTPDTPPAPTQPAGNASEEAWRTFALTQPGVTEEGIAGLGRDELRERFGSK